MATRKIAYLLKMFPRFSETFILNEILEMQRQGVPLHLISLREPNEPFRQSGVDDVRLPVTYVPGPLKLLSPAMHRTVAVLVRLLRAHACLLTRAPRGYAAALRDCLAQRRIKAVKLFLTAGYVANRALGEGIEHLHAHFANDPATVARYVHLLTGIPYSFTAHAKDIYCSSPETLRRSIHSASVVVTCTDANRRFLLDLAGAGTPVHTIRHGIAPLVRDRMSSMGQAEAAPKDPERPALILSVARLVDKKGLNHLIDACSLLTRRGVEYRCEIVGNGPLQAALQAQIDAAGLGSRVTLVDFMPHAALIDKYAQASLFVLPCQITDSGDRDGIPNVLVEAMVLGVPVVTTDVSGISELVEANHNGHVVPPRNPVALADAIEHALSDRACCSTYVKRANEKVMQEFDLRSNVSRLIEVFASH